MGPGMKFPRSEGGGSKEGIQGALGEEGATPEAVHILEADMAANFNSSLRSRAGPGSGEGNGNPLQNSCLGNPVDKGVWQVIVHGVTKELDMTE